MEGEVDPNAVTQEARSGEQKASFYLKAVYKNQKQTNGTEKQSSKAKSSNQTWKKMQKKIQNLPNRKKEQEHEQAKTNQDKQ